MCIKLAEADLTAQARLTAAQAAKTIQTGTKGAAEKFNHFVEGAGDSHPSSSENPGSKRTVQPERQDFWDSFGDVGADKSKSNSSIGTSAMKKKDEGWGNDW